MSRAVPLSIFKLELTLRNRLSCTFADVRNELGVFSAKPLLFGGNRLDSIRRGKLEVIVVW